jgi:hypothetical protein
VEVVKVRLLRFQEFQTLQALLGLREEMEAIQVEEEPP